ncbi:MAG: hypothetical protein ACO1TE_08120 [Prosthecobacter sp.]
MIITLLAATASAETVTVTGVDDNGEMGIYNIAGQNYWWMCIEPGTPALNATISAESMSLLDGWDQQNLERLNIYQSDLSLYTTVIPKQVAVMSYVLDTYLPWSTLAGASGRFIEQDNSSASYGNNETFYNSMMAIQNFLAETHGKAVKSDFTNMSDYLDYFASLGTPVGDARSLMFQNMLTDVAAKDGANFFDTYTAQHGYLVINTLFAEAAPENWQDGLMIYSLAPVPEPGGAVLIACCGIVWMLRRRRFARA